MYKQSSVYLSTYNLFKRLYTLGASIFLEDLF